MVVVRVVAWTEVYPVSGSRCQNQILWSLPLQLVVVLVVVWVEVGRILATGGVTAIVLMGLRSIGSGVWVPLL